MQRKSPPIEVVWERLHTWLRANAPAGYGGLRAGADEVAVREAEEVMGLTLPDDVKASYRVHDGQGREPGLIGGEGWQSLPLRDVVKTWGRWSQADAGWAQRVPIAWNAMSDYVFLNLVSGSEGSGTLMVQRADSADPDRLALSFLAWLEDFADELEDGVFVYSEEHGQVMLADDVD